MSKPSTDMLLRRMERRDLQTVLDLINKEGWDYHISEMERILRVDPENSIVMCSGDTVVGAITVAVFGRRCILGHVIVREGWRNNGLGRRMMDHLAERMDSMGVQTMEAFALKAALAFYFRHGYSIVEEIDTYDKRLTPQDVSRMVDPGRIKPLGNDDLRIIEELDGRVTGFERRRLLGAVNQEFPRHLKGLFDGGKLVGFILGRENPVMDDIGPWVMEMPNTEDGNIMLDSLLSEMKAGDRALGGVSANNSVVREVFLGREFKAIHKQYRVMRSKGKMEPFRPGMMTLGAFEFG